MTIFYLLIKFLNILPDYIKTKANKKIQMRLIMFFFRTLSVIIKQNKDLKSLLKTVSISTFYLKGIVCESLLRFHTLFSSTSGS